MIRTRFLAGVVLLAALAAPATAHFHLDSPASLTTQNGTGDPQKSPPCGPTDVTTVASGDVTTVLTGSMLTININATVPHPGHFRVSLAPDVASLPADPLVTASGGDPCGSTQIDTTPTLPVLADGLLQNATAVSGAESMQVSLPAGMQCTNCILQVLQYMSSHGQPCFYHHCAALTISDTAPPPVDGAPAGDDAGVDPGGEVGGGCCSSTRDAPSAFVLGLLVVGLLARRRRR